MELRDICGLMQHHAWYPSWKDDIVSTEDIIYFWKCGSLTLRTWVQHEQHSMKKYEKLFEVIWWFETVGSKMFLTEKTFCELYGEEIEKRNNRNWLSIVMDLSGRFSVHHSVCLQTTKAANSPEHNAERRNLVGKWTKRWDHTGQQKWEAVSPTNTPTISHTSKGSVVLIHRILHAVKNRRRWTAHFGTNEWKSLWGFTRKLLHREVRSF